MLTNKEKSLLFSIISKETGLSEEGVISKTRKPDYADARRIFAVIIKSNFNISLREIGNILGGRDHATIISSIKKHDELYESNKKYIEKYNNINSKFLVSKLVSNKVSYSIRELKQKKSKILHQLERDIVMIKRLGYKKNKKPSNIGLFIGSFNPIHNAHLIVANTAVHGYNFDEVWFVVASESPDKIKDNNVISFKNRIEIVKKCTINNPLLKVCDIEGSLPKPSYTYNTLFELRKKYSEYKFSIIMGSDNIANIEGWKNCKSIIKNHEIFRHLLIFYIFLKILFFH